MLSWKKIAVVSGLLSGLAVTGIGAAEAYDGHSSPVSCSRDAKLNVTCIQRYQYTNEDGSYRLSQTRNCTTAWTPRLSAAATGTRSFGRVDCANEAPGGSRQEPAQESGDQAPRAPRGQAPKGSGGHAEEESDS